jgi:hypothetical protein
MGKKAPPPPDYAAAAEATAEGSAQAARDQVFANRIDQVNPWGQLGYETYLDVDPSSGEQVTRWRQTQTLTPEAQAALDSQMAVQQGRSQLAEGMLGDIGQDYAQRMDFSQYGSPIGMDAMQRMGGAGQGIDPNIGQGIRSASIERLDPFNQKARTEFDFDDPGLEGQTLEKYLDYSQAPGVDAPAWTRRAAEESVYNRGASRLDPQFEQERQALDVRLRSQGLQPGDPAYISEMRDFQDRQTDAYDALQAQAIQEGARQAQSMFGMQSAYRDQATGEEDRMKAFRNAALLNQFGIDAGRQQQLYGIAEGIGQFGQAGDIANMEAALAARGQDAQRAIAQGQLSQAGNELGLRGQALGLQAQQQGWNQMLQQLGYNQNLGFRENALANALRTQGMNEDMAQRSYRLNELNALLSGQQVAAPSFNNFAQQSLAQGPDYLTAADLGYQADMSKFGADQALLNSLIGGGAQIGAGMASGGMFSDRRLKRNIHKIGEIKGVNWYEYDYIWGEHAIGVMADEVPWAAFDTPSGYKAVDYRRIY